MSVKKALETAALVNSGHYSLELKDLSDISKNLEVDKKCWSVLDQTHKNEIIAAKEKLSKDLEGLERDVSMLSLNEYKKASASTSVDTIATKKEPDHTGATSASASETDVEKILGVLNGAAYDVDENKVSIKNILEAMSKSNRDVGYKFLLDCMLICQAIQQILRGCKFSDASVDEKKEIQKMMEAFKDYIKRTESTNLRSVVIAKGTYNRRVSRDDEYFVDF